VSESLSPQASSAAPESREADAAEASIPLPVGTLFLMMLYIMVMAGMWLAMYFEFLGR
jgi:hypothetical protein